MLDNKTKARIAQEADKFAFVVPYDGSNKFYNEDKLESYIAGAEAEAVRAQGLIRSLQEIKDKMPEDDNFDAGQILFAIDDIVITALTNYNNIK